MDKFFVFYILMKPDTLINSVLGVIITAGVILAASDKEAQNIFLCVDSASADSKEVLYYTYIDGKRTECMKKQELLIHSNTESSGNEKDSGISSADKSDLIEMIDMGVKRLSEADLSSMDLMGVDLSGADLTGAELRSCDLRDADLSGADLTGADLSRAYLKKTNFRKCNLSRASFNKSSLIQANLLETKGLTSDSLIKAATLHKSSIPEEIRDRIKSLRPVLIDTSDGCWGENGWSKGDECEKIKRKPTIR
ncbi:MAG: pentapeptide repeat-containing protein [Chitinivibrionales bacterium]